MIHFLSGCPSGNAFLYVCQLTIFGRISCLNVFILHKHASTLFSCRLKSPRFWFHQITKLCALYALPHPLDLLTSLPTKPALKSMVKKCVLDHWASSRLRSRGGGIRIRAQIGEIIQGFTHIFRGFGPLFDGFW